MLNYSLNSFGEDITFWSISHLAETKNGGKEQVKHLLKKSIT